MKKNLPEHITIELIDHKAQDYDTAGNYKAISKHCWYVTISRMQDWRYSILVLIHEIIEMALTFHHDIKWEDIDAFDISNSEMEDPGACPKAPYHKEHMSAEKIERCMAFLLGVNWPEYEAALRKLRRKEPEQSSAIKEKQHHV
jgi:hypothetical protein